MIVSYIIETPHDIVESTEKMLCWHQYITDGVIFIIIHYQVSEYANSDDQDRHQVGLQFETIRNLIVNYDWIFDGCIVGEKKTTTKKKHLNLN